MQKLVNICDICTKDIAERNCFICNINVCIKDSYNYSISVLLSNDQHYLMHKYLCGDCCKTMKVTAKIYLEKVSNNLKFGEGRKEILEEILRDFKVYNSL